MKIDRIYIACFKHDVRLTRILVASIRTWYPEIPISLVKDERYGPFDTTEMERLWDVSVLVTERRQHGWGFGKLEPLFLPGHERCLILDSDIVMVGPVLDMLARYDEDFIVTEEVPPDGAFVERLYFDLERLKRLDPEFSFPGWTFNTGQIVATTGVLTRADFDGHVRWTTPPEPLHTDIFRCGEQGLLNYIVMDRLSRGALSLRRVRFMEVADNAACLDIKRHSLTAGSPYRFVVHWCGLPRNTTRPGFEGTIRADILLHFERIYYARLPWGAVRRILDPWSNWGKEAMRGVLRSMPGLKQTVRRLRGANPD